MKNRTYYPMLLNKLRTAKDIEIGRGRLLAIFQKPPTTNTPTAPHAWRRFEPRAVLNYKIMPLSTVDEEKAMKDWLNSLDRAIIMRDKKAILKLYDENQENDLLRWAFADDSIKYRYDTFTERANMVLYS